MTNDVLTWPEMAMEIFDKLTGREAEVIYEFENLEIFVPAYHAEDAKLARWKLNGVLKIRTRAKPD
ncbi:MAG: hypothetical protein WBN08_08320 [Thiogranum sp.]|jgi:hypothetical protein